MKFKLPEKEIEELLNKWIQLFNELNKIHDDIDNLFLSSPESPAVKTMYNVFYKYTELLADKIGISDDWLGWFLWENDAGKNGYKAGIKGKMIKIKTIKDLIKMLKIT